MGAGTAATYERFADGDLVVILAAHPAGEQPQASESYSMQPSTRVLDTSAEAVNRSRLLRSVVGRVGGAWCGLMRIHNL